MMKYIIGVVAVTFALAYGAMAHDFYILLTEGAMWMQHCAGSC